ncbi:MAG: A24 family peptidase [Lachnospiraceae bacterium]|nr:A24 family peptidase [Lachnospiraceae bacterium]
MHYYIGLIIEALFLFFADIVAIRYNEIKAEKTLRAKIQAVKGMGSKARIYSAYMFVVLVATAFLLVQYKGDNTILMNVERVYLISLILPAMFYDLREERIPNKLVVYGTICRLMFIIPEMLLEDDIIMTWIMESVAVVIMVFVAVAILLIYEEAFGMGDVKLFAVMGAYLGIGGLFAAMFYTGILSGIASVFLIILRRKKLKDTMKYAPFIVWGTIIAIFVFGA